MALTSAQQVRLGIQDHPKVARDTYTADGISTGYQIPHLNVTTASAYVQVAGAWSATGAVFASGEVAFANRISANSAFMVHYTYSVFSDEEIDHMLTVGGNINGARKEAVQDLMFDSLKRARWQSPDGTMFDDTKAMDMLAKMYDKFTLESTQDAIGGGAILSWGANQQ